MSIIEEIKRDIHHDIGCGFFTGSADIKGKCDCRKRRKIAYLERLEEPTEGMLNAGADAVLDELSARGGMPERVCWKAMLAAAEEAQ